MNRTKLYLLITLLTFAGAKAGAQSTGIGTIIPVASAQLDVTATNKGFLPPRVALTGPLDITTIPSPAAGLTVYNTNTGKLNVWDGTKWTAPINTAEQAITGAATVYNYTGAVQTFTVPAGVTAIVVDASGAKGGIAQNGSTNLNGGKGGRVQTTLTVTPGEVLNIYVGGLGGANSSSSPGGFNGGGIGYQTGGGGGGATDIRRAGTALSNRILVAAGGGGAAAANLAPGDGGNGGGLTGGTGGNGGYGAAYPGTGATQTAGGLQNGGLGVGGDAVSGSAAGGGGGGGGYYGGGGARANVPAGGGGGSSYIAPTGATGTTMTSGYNNGAGVLTIGGVAGYAAPVLSGINFVNVPGTWGVSGTNYYYNGGSVGIGTAAPDASAILDVTATGKGVLIPRMPLASRPATPVTGLMIYQTDNTPGFYYYTGTAWSQLGATGPAGAPGAQGVVAVGSMVGAISSIAGSGTAYVFAGPTATITVTSSSQKIVANAVGAMGLATASGTGIDIVMCYQPSAGGTINTFVTYPTVPMSTERRLYPSSATVSGLAPGTYNIGLGVFNHSTSAINNNDWVNGWVMVTN